MIKLSLSPLDYILAKNEFIKDHGGKYLRYQNDVRLQYLTTDNEGSAIFRVYLHGQLSLNEWILDKQDLTRLTSVHLTHPNRKLTPLELIGMLSKKIGITLVKEDIESIDKIEGGWLITMSPDSIRFEGSFKIKKSL